jgi:membrane protein
MSSRKIWFYLKTTIQEWQKDNALRLGASLSYYTVFSLAPLLMIVIAIASLVFGSDVARERIMQQMQMLLGPQGAFAIGDMLAHQRQHPVHGIITTIIGLVTLLLGASGVVGELQETMNTIWDAPKPKGGLMVMVRQRLLSFAMILGIGFLLLVSLILSAALSGLTTFYGTAVVFEVLNFIISIGIITVLFAAMFQFLPDVRIAWRDVWIGAFATSLLFTIGKTVTGIYLAKSAVASTFGAAGSLVIILVWVYYNSQILFLGAEFTQVYARDRKQHEEREEEMAKEEEYHPEDHEEEKESPLYKVAYHAGYQHARLNATETGLERKWKVTKWIYRVVDFLGFRRSVKVAWKGYKVKRKIDELTVDDSEKKPIGENQEKSQTHSNTKHN